ncbi:MAG: N5-glutamine methyltransferase family protein [Limisphaerales bacterium]
MTVLEAIQKSAEFLGKKNIDSPRLQTELLLAHLLKMPRMKLYLNFERALSAEETNQFRELIKRRGQREPLQHITGSTSFCGFEIAVNRHALVPRPETELLAEAGWNFLSTINHQPSTALDFGTGTGCIAIALAAKCPMAKITAIDISLDTIALAKENAGKNNVAEQIEFFQGNGFETLQNVGQASRLFGERASASESLPSASLAATGKVPVLLFDLIVSNPPYIPTAEIETLQPEVKNFDPRNALDGGVDGLDFYRMFATRAKPFLKPDGKIMLEFGDGQAEAIRKIFENEKWIVGQIKSDYSQRERILIAKK